MMDGYGFRFSRPVGALHHPATGEVLQIDALFEQVSAANGLSALKVVHA
jgi:hypothetical protein